MERWMPRVLLVVCVIALAWGVLRWRSAHTPQRAGPQAVTRPVATTASPKRETQTAVMEHRLLAPKRVQELQQLLKQAGFDPGPVDGQWGQRTKRALLAFQRAQRLPVDGMADQRTWDALRRSSRPTASRPQ